jgi:hypothetical protein
VDVYVTPGAEQGENGLSVVGQVLAVAPGVRAQKPRSKAEERRIQRSTERARRLTAEMVEERGWVPPLRGGPALPARGTGWNFDEKATLRIRGEEMPRATVWRSRGLYVITDLVEADYRGEVCKQNHLSVSVAGVMRRATNAEMARVRADFDMEDAEEDNHSPGVARHLFLPLHLPRGSVGVCDCKEDEEQVVEPDGYRWSRAKAVAPS